MKLQAWEKPYADFKNPGEITSYPKQVLCTHWWLCANCNHFNIFHHAIYLKTWCNSPHCFHYSHYSSILFLFYCLHSLCFNMSAQLNASSSHAKSYSLIPMSKPHLGRTSSMEPAVIHKGRFIFQVERNETRVSTTTLASSVQSHYETFCLVGKVFGVLVNSRVIKHRLKGEWKNLQGDVSIDHTGRDWYKVVFFFEEDVLSVLENRPYFVQG